MGQKFSVSFPDALAQGIREEARAKNIKLSQLLQLYAELGLSIADAPDRKTLGVKSGLVGTLTTKAQVKRLDATAMAKAIESRRFNPSMKKALRLVLLDGLTQTEAAKQAGITHRQAINHALRTLKQL